MRLLEQHNPDVQFDWPRLLKESASEPPPRRDRDVREERIRERRERRDQRRPQRPPTSAAAAPPLATGDAEERAAVEQRAADHAAYAGSAIEAEPEAGVEASATALPGSDVLREPPLAPTEADAAADEGEPSPATMRLGRDGVARLRTRYQDILARLADKDDLEEPARIELKRSAERLNPDGWRTAEEVAAALEGYEAVFEYLRSVVGRHTRRPK